MNLVTHRITKLKIMKTPRRKILAAGVLAMTASSFVVTSNISLASSGLCYNRDGYSFSNETFEGGTLPYSNIKVYRGRGCGGRAILQGSTVYDVRNRQVTLAVKDYKHDNTGIILYTHGPSVSSNGAKNRDWVVNTFSLDSFSRPYHFWVRVGGTTNSNAANLPIP